MPGHAPRLPPYPYSGGHWSQPLPVYPYAPYSQQYPWGYPQYASYAGGPAMGSYPGPGYPVSPGRKKEKRRHSLTPPPEIKLHHLLGGRYRPTTVWDVGQDIPAARHVTERGSLEKISNDVLAEPATSPPVHKMRIVSDAFPWDMNITLPRSEIVTVDHILNAIYGILQESLDKEDWDEETPNAKRNMHKARCARLSRGAATYKVDMHLKKVDALGDRTFFLGLKPVGPPEEPDEWLLKLGTPPKAKPGRR